MGRRRRFSCRCHGSSRYPHRDVADIGAGDPVRRAAHGQKHGADFLAAAGDSAARPAAACALAPQPLGGTAGPGISAERALKPGNMASLVSRALHDDQRRFVPDRAGCHPLSRQRDAAGGEGMASGDHAWGHIPLDAGRTAPVLRLHHRQSVHQ